MPEKTNREYLTLEDCLEQERGTEGRLFETDDEKIHRHQGDAINTYYVIRKKEAFMDIEAYQLGGTTKTLTGVPIAERREDKVMSQEDLMTWYIGVGKALGTASGCSALSS